MDFILLFLLLALNYPTKLKLEQLERPVQILENRRQKSHWRRSGVFIVNFEHISHLILVLLLLTLSR